MVNMRVLIDADAHRKEIHISTSLSYLKRAVNQLQCIFLCNEVPDNLVNKEDALLVYLSSFTTLEL